MKLTAIELEDRLYDLKVIVGDDVDHNATMLGLERNFIIEVEPTESGVCQFQQSRSLEWTDVFTEVILEDE